MTYGIDWQAVGIAIVFGYLLGSIPFGLIFTRMAGGGDVRKIGSGNIGATNVLRTGKKGAAVATLIFDGLKGVAAVLFARHFLGEVSALFAAIAAFAGHLFPVWLGFRGGKGVATFIGVMFALYWPVGLCVAATWLVIAAALRYSSLAALFAAALSPTYMLYFAGTYYAIVAIVLAIAIFLTHRENIVRLANRTEPRIGDKH